MYFSDFRFVQSIKICTLCHSDIGVASSFEFFFVTLLLESS